MLGLQGIHTFTKIYDHLKILMGCLIKNAFNAMITPNAIDLHEH